MTATRRGAAADTAQLLWRVRPATAPTGMLCDRRGDVPDGPRCAGVVIEHVDGTGTCELGSGCRVGLDEHDVGADCPGPEDGCPHCRLVFHGCDAPVIEHGPGDGTGPLVCTAGHDADDLDSADRGRERVYHPGSDTYPCTRADCVRCAAPGAGPGTAPDG